MKEIRIPKSIQPFCFASYHSFFSGIFLHINALHFVTLYTFIYIYFPCCKKSRRI